MLRTESLKAHAHAMSRGLEAKVSIAVDVMYPIRGIGQVLKELHETYPTLSVGLFVETLGGVAELVLDGACALGVLATLPGTPSGLTGHAMQGILTLPVAAPDHPLALLPEPVPASAVRDAVQIVLTDRSRHTEGRDFGVLSRRTWRVSDLGAKRDLLLEGLGWGTMPVHSIAADTTAGALKVLHLEAVERPGETLPVNVVHRADAALGPAATWILGRLKQQASAVPMETAQD